MIQGLLLHSVSYSGAWRQPFLPLEEFLGKSAAIGTGGLAETMAYERKFVDSIRAPQAGAE